MSAAAVLLGVLVFVAAAVYDAIFAAYVRNAAGGRAARAALYSVMTYLVGAIGLLALVKASVWYAVPEGAGLFVGTLIGVGLARDID